MLIARVSAIQLQQQSKFGYIAICIICMNIILAIATYIPILRMYIRIYLYVYVILLKTFFFIALYIYTYYT